MIMVLILEEDRHFARTVGRVGIDMRAGPTDSPLLADETTEPFMIG